MVVGNICESGDIFSRSGDKIERYISSPEIGQRMAFLDAGAYGYSMSHNFNTRPRASEILLNGKSHQLIRRRETIKDIFSGCDV